MKKMRQKDDGSDKSSEVNYDDLMKGANVMKIGEEDEKKKMRHTSPNINQSRNKGNEEYEESEDIQYSHFMAQGNVVVIRESNTGEQQFMEENQFKRK